VLGALGIGGQVLEQELERLDRTWSPPRYTPRQRTLLRQRIALRIVPALILDSAVFAAWERELRIERPVWKALVISARSPDLAWPHVVEALDTPEPALSEATRWFLVGTAAAGAGEHERAASFFSRLDSLPLDADRPDLGWGLRGLSLLLRARSYEAAGRTELARESYQRHQVAWAAADTLGHALRRDAAAALRRLNPE